MPFAFYLFIYLLSSPPYKFKNKETYEMEKDTTKKCLRYHLKVDPKNQLKYSTIYMYNNILVSKA